ncbi:hypothetical protein SNE40_006176 [Patella caerulea]
MNEDLEDLLLDPDMSAEESVQPSTEGEKNFMGLLTILEDETVLHKLANSVASIMLPQMRQEIRDSVQHTIKTLNKKIDFLESELKDRDIIIDDILDKLDESEQYSRREAVRINGITEMSSESTDKIVADIGAYMGIDMSINDINRSHRVGNPKDYDNATRPRPIIARFKGYSVKRDFMKNRKKMKDSKSDPILPPCMKNHSIYINDDLTNKRALIDSKCRKLYKDKKIIGNWSMDGIIFVKTQSGNVILIRTERDYMKLEESLSLKITIKKSHLQNKDQDLTEVKSTD